MNVNFLKKFVFNRNTVKRFAFIYVPVALLLYVALTVASFLSENPDQAVLGEGRSYRDNISIVYSPHYNISFGGLEERHPFDAHKYAHIFAGLQAEMGTAITDKFILAHKPSQDMLALAQTKEYQESLKSSWTLAQITELGFLRFFPDRLSHNIVLEPMLYQTGGSLQAAQAALEHGWAINLGGGFHHASANSGGGFCAVPDIGLVVKQMRKEGKAQKVMIIDLDAHQGNGHERDFGDDPDIFTIDFYNTQVYPHDERAKEGIDLEVALRSMTGDKLYLALLAEKLPQAFEKFSPDLIIYVAGTDILEGDPLGGLSISEEGVIARDEMVFKNALERKTPIVMLLGGGYQKSNAGVISRSILNLNETFGLIKGH